MTRLYGRAGIDKIDQKKKKKGDEECSLSSVRLLPLSSLLVVLPANEMAPRYTETPSFPLECKRLFWRKEWDQAETRAEDSERQKEREREGVS